MKIQVTGAKSMYSFCLAGVLLAAQTLSAQKVWPGLAKGFNSSIVTKVYDLAVKTGLNTQAQQWFATALANKDSMIMMKIAEGLPPSEVTYYADSIEGALETNFKILLNPADRQRYQAYLDETSPTPFYVNKRYLSAAEMNTQFGMAIKMRTKLHLRDGQVDSLIGKADEMAEKISLCKINPDAGFFDAPAFESEHLSKMLSERQYNDLLVAKNRESSDLQARYDWHDMEELGLTNKFGRDSTLKKLMTYYLLKAHIKDCYAHEKEKQALYLKSLRMPYPLVVLREARIGKNDKLARYAW